MELFSKEDCEFAAAIDTSSKQRYLIKERYGVVDKENDPDDDDSIPLRTVTQREETAKFKAAYRK